MNEPRPLPSCDRRVGDVSWTETRERLDADWTPVRDDKQRLVHGHAIIVETPAELLGRTLRDRSWTLTIGELPFSVSIIATRDGAAFGAIPRSTGHATRELAIKHARRALNAQGKRYAKRYAAQSNTTPSRNP